MPGRDGAARCDPNSAAAESCVDVEFEYPTSDVVEGVLP
jgi:hypothetical protein